MQAYLIRRLLYMIPTLLFVTIVIFFIIRLIPGNVVDLMVIEQQGTTDMQRDEIERKLGLDKPVYVQYYHWMSGVLLRGDLGKSLWSERPVLQEILYRFPVTLELAAFALLISLIIALPVGIFSAVRQNTAGDYIARSAAIACIAVPSLWIGTMIMVFPAILWGWLPPLEYVHFSDDPLGNLHMIVIPGSLLGMVLSGATMRMTRTMMLEVLNQDYIRTAWAKGLREGTVIARHALKNALIPVITIIGIRIPTLIGGSVVIERIFNLPGLGSLLIDTISGRDYIMLSGINLVVAVIVLFVNLIVDLAYAFLDPRVQYK